MKAWGCVDYNAECGVIVFAETAGKARKLSMTTGGLDESEWTDIEVRRIPMHDNKRPFGTVLEWREDMVLYYEAGWYPEFGTPQCDRCGRYQFADIPDSALRSTQDGAVCVACLRDPAPEFTGKDTKRGDVN